MLFELEMKDVKECDRNKVSLLKTRKESKQKKICNFFLFALFSGFTKGYFIYFTFLRNILYYWIFLLIIGNSLKINPEGMPFW
jgi:hypothetical protein